jgi:HlyD family secretion protein
MAVAVSATAGLITFALALPRRSGADASAHTAVIVPRSMYATARFGGVVREILVHDGQSVQRGQLLARMEAEELESRRRDLKRVLDAIESNAGFATALNRLPPRAREAMVAAHPDVVAAEARYVEALEKSPKDLEAAARERIEARRRALRNLKSFSSSDASRTTLAIRETLAQTEQMIAETELRAPEDAVVDLCVAKPGDRAMPNAPIVALLSRAKYVAEITLPPRRADALKSGTDVRATLSTGLSLDARIESITEREIPVPFRDRREVSRETLLRLELRPPFVIPPGAVATFELP